MLAETPRLFSCATFDKIDIHLTPKASEHTALRRRPRKSTEQSSESYLIFARLCQSYGAAGRLRIFTSILPEFVID